MSSTEVISLVGGLIVMALGVTVALLTRRVAVQKAALTHLNRVLERQTMTDEVTGLLNRRRLETEIEGEIERARRYKHPLAGILIDIDDFKRINQTRGRPMGDIALQKISSAIRSCIRRVDLAGRYGSDEFLIVLPETLLESARTVAFRIQDKVRNFKIDVPRPELTLTVSIGLFAFPDCAFLDKKTFLETVDLAMLKAKKAGKDKIVSG